MLRIDGLDQGLEIFKALGSDVRMQIVQLLSENGPMSTGAIAASTGMTPAALSGHIRKLTEAGIIEVNKEQPAGEKQKVYSLISDQLLFSLYPQKEEKNVKVYETQICVGHYSDYQVQSPCGLAGNEALIGPENDPRAFAWPERVDAGMLWFHDGYIEYRIPNLLPEKQTIVQITLSFEVSSADQGDVSDSLSDICFFLNGRSLGEWRSIPFTDSSRGIYTPTWWRRPERQHGYLKMLVINHSGVFLDGAQISGPIESSLFPDSTGEMKFRFEARPREGREAGLALYGKQFGNYHHDILARIHYMPEEVVNG